MGYISQISLKGHKVMGHRDKSLEFVVFFFTGVQARALSRLVNMVPAMTWSWHAVKLRSTPEHG